MIKQRLAISSGISLHLIIEQNSVKVGLWSRIKAKLNQWLDKAR